ncbi:hypothetical protein [Levilactobacillus suantsaii]|nr:hypothetical protein [Levilactobacillus suantsaii]QMU08218.1 hypothetical protein H3M12_00595 [Levilactobacillus suantsaii]
MTAVLIILLIILFAAGGQLYLNNLAAFRKKSKHLAERDRFSSKSNQRLS